MCSDIAEGDVIPTASGYWWRSRHAAGATIAALSYDVKNHSNRAPMKTILEALDKLALALAEHHHTWTPLQRNLYEDAIKIASHMEIGSLA